MDAENLGFREADHFDPIYGRADAARMMMAMDDQAHTHLTSKVIDHSKPHLMARWGLMSNEDVCP